MEQWFVGADRTPVVWNTAVVGGYATQDIFRIVDRGDGIPLRSLWARSGSFVGTSRVASATLAASADPVPPEVTPPPSTPLVSTAPAHAGYRTKPYDQRSNVYNWKASNTRKLRAALGQGGYFTTPAHICCVGDSVTEGQVGSGTWNMQFAWPAVLRAALVAGGDLAHPGAGGVLDGGLSTHFGSAATNGFDNRVAKTGTWLNNASGYVSSVVDGSTLTFPTAAVGQVVRGTAIYVAFIRGGGTFSVAVDGGAPVAVNVTGSGFGLYTVTGLTDGPHTVVVTKTGTTLAAIVGMGVYRTYGLMVHNMGKSGSTAQQWADPAAGSIYAYRLASLPSGVVAGATILSLGANDLIAGRTIAQIKADIIAVRARFASGDIILMNYPESGAPHALWPEFNRMFYDIADELDCPLIDVYARYGPYAVANGNGIMSADQAHPNTRYQADLGRAIARLLAA